MKINS